jgi:hypothetical protein
MWGVEKKVGKNTFLNITYQVTKSSISENILQFISSTPENFKKVIADLIDD